MAREITDISEIKNLFSLPSVAESRVCVRDPSHQFGNARTAIAQRFFVRPEGPPLPPLDAKTLFVDCFPELQRRMRCHGRQGVLALAIDEQHQVLGHAWLKATTDKTRAAIIGRHSMCDLAIPDRFSDVSLRHLAVLTRAISHDEVRLRVIDLRTAIGFSDEAGRLLRAVSAEGSIFLRVGAVRLMLLVTNGDDKLPDSADDAYACIPERVFINEREGVLGLESPRKRGEGPWNTQSSITFVRAHAGPLAVAAELCDAEEASCGSVVVRTDTGVLRRPVGLAALERGVLVGRYSRCDVGLRGHQESRLSRVHLLIVKDQDEIFAIDTASTNGTRFEDREILLKQLGDGDQLVLGGELDLTWHEAA